MLRRFRLPCVIAASALFFLSCAVSAVAQPCDELWPALVDEQRSLYEYSLIAGIPSGDDKNSCRVTESDILESRGHEFKNLLDGDYVYQAARENELRVGVYADSHNSKYFTCDIDDGAVGRGALVLGMRNPTILLAGYWAFAANGVDIVWTVRVATAFIEESWKEKLEYVKLSRVGSDGPETLLAIRHADTLRYKVTALAALAGESCTFDLAAQLVGQILGTTDGVKRLAVIGHSLGGAATQHIVQRVSQDGETRYDLDGYAFSSFGLDADPQTEGVTSYYIKGDWLTTIPLRRQIGRVLRYAPRQRWGWSSVTKHHLETVQTAICKCIRGQGTIYAESPRQEQRELNSLAGRR